VRAVSSRWLPGTGSRERPSFAKVAEAELDAVFRYLVFLTGRHDLAEELTADAFERALRSWRKFDPRRGNARSWLCQVARSTALDHFRAEERRRRREQRYAEDADAVAAPVTLGEGFSPELEQALRTLSAGEREVLGLRVVLELDAAAAARLLGISATACSTRLSRALHKLEERLESNALA
jgi:RNA polymerase sigma-70 factor (ECF subfamily)